MHINILPSVEFIKDRLDYDPELGVFWWKFRDERTNPNPSTRKTWNKRYAGNVAGKVTNHNYRSINLDGKTFYEHRIAWKLMTGKEPELIDHQDGNRSNNKFANLRNTNYMGNNRNLPVSASNTSGHIGVGRCKGGKWQAYIKVNRLRIHLGTFDDIADAIKARKDAEVEFEFHRNHGREKI